MKTRILLVATILLCCTTLQAGRRNRRIICCPVPCYSGPTTKLWKGKDGVIRETITHWQALHRSVEAEHLETEMVEVKAQLESTTADLDQNRAELVAAKKGAAAEKAAYEQMIAALKAKVEQQTKLTENQKNRADKAEATNQASLTALAKTETILTKVQTDLDRSKTNAGKLDAANKKLLDDLATMAAARDESVAALKLAQGEVEKLKQEAIEPKKAAVARKDDDYEKDPPKKDSEEDDAEEDDAEEEEVTEEDKN